MEDISREKLMKYEKDEAEGLLIRIPFPIGTPVLAIKPDSEGQVGTYRLCVYEFELVHLKLFNEGLIFTDVVKASEKLIEMNQPKEMVKEKTYVRHPSYRI